MADYVVKFNGQDNLSSTINKVKSELNDFGKVGETALNKFESKFNKITNSTAPLKRQLRDLQALMSEMNFKGLTDTKQFTQIAEYAGMVKDAIGDAAEATRKYSHDTMSLQAGIQAFQGLAAAGSVATGVMALFGTENEKAAQVIQKVQGTLAILNGVQVIANTLNKDSALILRLKQLKMNILSVSTNQNTIATAVNTTATSVNTTANKAWNITKAIGKAMLGDFTGLLLVGAGALATYAIATSDSAEQQENLNKSVEDSSTFLDKQVEASKEVAKSIDNEKYQIAQLTNILYDENAAYDDKVAALNNLKSIIPSVNGYISSEGVYHGNAVVAIRNHIAALDDLQKALAAFKLGQKIQQQVTDTEWEKFKAQEKVNRKQNNIRADNRQIQKFQSRAGTYTTLQEGKRANDQYAQTLKRKDINELNLKTAKEEYKTAEIKSKQAKKEQQEFQKFQRTQGTSKAQAAVAIANGDPTKATNIFIGRQDIASGRAGGKVGKGGGGRTAHTPAKTTVTPEMKDVEELKKYQESLNRLKEQYNKHLLSELEYNKEVLDVEENHLKYLYKNNKVTQDNVDKYNKAVDTYKQSQISVEFDTNLDELNKQLDDGFIDQEEYLNNLADLQKDYYLKNLKAGTATKEMADAYKEAYKEAQKLQKDSELNVVLNTEYTKKESSFDKTVKANEPVTFDSQLSAIEDQMNFNDNLIEQLNTIKQLYEELGLVGTESYDSINAKILESTESNEKLGEQAVSIKKKQTDWENKQKEIDSYSEAISQLGSTFSGLGSAMGGANDQWLNFTSQALEGTAKIIPVIQKLIAAKQVEAIASGTAEAAKIPFPANLAAIFSIVATVASVFASLPKFANGGIVTGGSTHGDRVLARLNAGEMVLSTRQQSNLFNAIDNGMFGTTKIATINFKLKGSDIYGSLKNFTNIKSKTSSIKGL